MPVVAPYEYVLLQAFAPRRPFVVALVADDAVVRYDDDGQVVAPSDDGNVEDIAFTVPRLPGMSAIVVDRASLTVLGRRREQVPVTASATSSAESRTLSGPGGALARLEIRDLMVSDPGDGVALPATTGTVAGYRWRDDDGTVVVSRSLQSSDRRLHLLFSADGPPFAAVPHYDMPDNAAGLYGPVLAGAELQVDHPTSGALTVVFDPPVPCDQVRVLLATNDETHAHAGLPHEAEPVRWTAASVTAVWAAAPSAVSLAATTGAAGPIPVADFPGEVPAAETPVDFTPAARSLLADAYAADDAAAEDLELRIAATSASAGELAARQLTLSTHYRFDSVGPDGLAVSLQGRPQTVDLPLPPSLVPQQVTVTVDGRFGPGVLLTASDGDGPGRRSGVRLSADVRAARRLPLSDAERLRPLLRATLLLDADVPAEVLVEVAADRDGRLGPPLADPVAITVAPGAGPRWLAATLPAVVVAAPALWLVVRATAGTARWYAEPASPDPALALVSTDAGGTWAATTARGCAQVHVVAERPEPAPLTLHWPGGLVATDVLTLPAVRTLIETTGADAQQREATGDAAVLAAVPLEQPVGRTVTFRKEGLTPFAPSALPTFATLGDTAALTFSCPRDCDLRVLDVTLRYHPAEAR